jgi:tRNA wybutosine-synthesizing protein 2
MTFLAIKVPKSKADEIRKRAESIGAKDRDRLITTEGDYVIIPILEGFEDKFKDFELIEQENPIFIREKSIYEVLKNKIPSDLQNYIPRSYKILGDIILVKISNEVSSYSKEIGEALLRIHPKCRSVWRDLGKEGALRRPTLEFLAGDPRATETTKLENGCYFKFDVKKVMFSPGNQYEKMRVAGMIEEGEVVVDMFAGVGYFSIPIAKHSRARKIYAIEINPESYHYLLENMRLNEVTNIIPILGDSKFVTPEGVADRVLMGHINCHEFIEVAIRALKNEGFIHYHEAVPLAVKDRPVRRLKDAASQLSKEIKILNLRKVKNYSPGVVHVVVDAYVY